MTQLYLKITDTNTILWTNSQGLQAKAPIFPFKIYDEIELQFLNEENLPYTNFNDATTFKVSGDINFVYPEPDDVMFKTVDADIDKSDIADGILRFPIDTNTTNFRDVIEGSREKTIYLEIEGTGLVEATPRVVWRKSVIVTAQAAISIDGTVPEGVITDYFTKTEVNTLLNSKVETDLSGYPTDVLDGTEEVYVDAAGTPSKVTAQAIADLGSSASKVEEDLSGYPTDTLDGTETVYVDATGIPSKATTQAIANLVPPAAGGVTEDLSGYPTDTLDGTETMYVDAAGTPSKVTAQAVADLGGGAGKVEEDLSGYPTDTLDGTETMYVDAGGTPSKVTAQAVADLAPSPAGKVDEDLSGYPTDTLSGTETVYVDAAGTPSKVTAQAIADLGGGGGSGGASGLPFVYDDSSTSATGIASTEWRTNNANPASATELYFSEDTVDPGFGVSDYFLKFNTGDLFLLTVDGNSTLYYMYEVNGTITYDDFINLAITVPVTILAVGGAVGVSDGQTSRALGFSLVPEGVIAEDLSGYPTDTLSGTETVYVDAAGTPSKVTAQAIADLAPPASGGVTEDLSGYPTDTLDGTETMYVDAAGTPSKVTAQNVADLGGGEANAAQASGGEITAGTETATRDHSPADIVSYVTQHETGEANAAQASGGEITAGTETATRDHSPADIVSYITQHGGGGGGGLTWNAVSVNTPAVNENGYMIDASGNTVDLTLPITPSVGDTVGVKAIDRTNTITLLRNGSNINGVAEDLTVDIDEAGFTLVYQGATYGWVIVTEVSAGGGAGGGGGFADEGTRIVKTASYTILDAELTGNTFQLGSAATADYEFTLPTTVGTDEAADGVYIENFSNYNLRIIMANASDRINHTRTDLYLHKGDGRVLFRPYATDNNWSAE